jgi:hypothetical protein
VVIMGMGQDQIVQASGVCTDIFHKGTGGAAGACIDQDGGISGENQGGVPLPHIDEVDGGCTGEQFPAWDHFTGLSVGPGTEKGKDRGEQSGQNADAIDFLLNGGYYMSASGPVFNPKNNDSTEELDDPMQASGVAIRCVRDAF